MRSFWGSLVVVIIVAVAGRAQKRTLRFSYCYHDHHCDHDHHYIVLLLRLCLLFLFWAAFWSIEGRSTLRSNLNAFGGPFHLIRVTFVASSSPPQMCLEVARSCSRFLERFASLFTISVIDPLSATNSALQTAQTCFCLSFRLCCYCYCYYEYDYCCVYCFSPRVVS